MSRATKKVKVSIFDVKSKAWALWHFRVDLVCKIDATFHTYPNYAI